ncbi:transposase [bacterium]|nr:transposase [bacterium]
MSLFNNKYRVETARLKHWNYANIGMYFITVCSTDKIYHFGKIIDENVVLDKVGKFAKQCWDNIPNHFPFVELDEFIIMPNHIHGIIGIDKPDDVINNNDVETLHATSLQMSNISPQFGSLSSIIRSFKSAVTKYANKNDIPFKWQTRFYDRVIRDENELFNSQRYIIENPLKWKLDKYYLN